LLLILLLKLLLLDIVAYQKKPKKTLCDMQCMRCLLSSTEHGPAAYAFVLVTGSQDVPAAVERVLDLNGDGNGKIAPGCCTYCRKCSRLCRLAASSRAQTAVVDAVVRQDADRALFMKMQQNIVRLY
jgi:hypothetical protein